MEVSLWRVLIIDDEPDNLGVVQHVLNFYGARVQTAQSGSRGMEMLLDSRPDFLLLDIQMPRKSGYEVLADIRAHPSLSSLPVIALTSYARQEDRERALESGFDGYITKPISVATFIPQISSILTSIQRSTS